MTTFRYHKIQRELYILGSVLANRLSEVDGWKVLLLEAGGLETVMTDIPIFAGHLQLSSVDWQYKTEPQKNSCQGRSRNEMFTN